MEEGVTVSIYNEEQSGWQRLVSAGVSGLVAGLTSWLAFWGADTLLVRLFCGDGSALACVYHGEVASVVAVLAGAVVGALALVYYQLPRPPLVVAVAAAGLWGLGPALQMAPWYEAAGWTLLISGLLYITLTWIGLLGRGIWAVVGLMLVVLVVVRAMSLI